MASLRTTLIGNQTTESMKAIRHNASRVNAFTTAELLVATAASSLVIGAVLMASASLSRTFRATESYSRAQAAQVRLIDAIAMDLRRATAIGITTSATSDPSAGSNTTVKFAHSAGSSGNSKTIQDGTYDAVRNIVNGKSGPSTYLTLTIPGYYQSSDPTSSNFRRPTTLISTGSAVRYGTSGGVANDVTVQYRKQYVSQYGSECYIRREAGRDQVIAERAEAIDVDIIAQPDGVSFIVDAWFAPPFKRGTQNTARVTSSDRVMLRNPRRD